MLEIPSCIRDSGIRDFCRIERVHLEEFIPRTSRINLELEMHKPRFKAVAAAVIGIGLFLAAANVEPLTPVAQAAGETSAVASSSEGPHTPWYRFAWGPWGDDSTGICRDGYYWGYHCNYSCWERLRIGPNQLPTVSREEASNCGWASW